MAGRRTGILGAGALGLTLAYRLAQAGDDVTVIEREPEPGGLAAGFPVATAADGSPVYLEKFYHHLFAGDHAAINLIAELGLGDRLLWPKPVSTILRDGQIYRLDGVIPLLRLKPLPFIDRVRLGAVLAYLRAEKVYQRLEGHTAEQWLQKWMGTNAFSLFAEPLLTQKFGAHANQVAMPWFWSRVHLRSAALGYLRGGFQYLYLRLLERVRAQGGQVHLSTTVTRIRPRPDGTIDVEAGDALHSFDRVVSTLPARLTIDLTEGMPEEFRARYGGGTALGAHCLVLEVDRQATDAYWIAINDPGFPFLAVVEHTNYIPPEEYNGKHLIYIGNYVPMDHVLFRRSGEETLREFLPYLRKVQPDFSAAWVNRIHSFAAPFAQPIVTVDFRARMAPHTTPVPNLSMANMFQIYPQDRGQNYSVTMAERMARRLTRNDAGRVAG
jgi:protoporphyrinogen oxidase